MTTKATKQKKSWQALEWNPGKLTLAAALALTLGAGSTYAQTQTDASDDYDDVYIMDTFEVVGIRESYEKAVEIKRQSYQMVDALVAEDIGKFPDNNLVEALQRISGVQVTDRGGGEIGAVSIRGLNDVTTTINGRNIFTASGRSVSLQDIPASLLAGVNVFKTRAASHIETGIAGVIDIQTHRPFNFDGDRYSVALRGIYQEQSSHMDPNVSALASTTWENSYGKFGALVNVSYATTHYRDQNVTAGAMIPFLSADAPAGWVPYERIFLTDGRVTENPIWQAGLELGLPSAAGSTLKMNGVDQEYVLSRDAIFQNDYTGKRERPAANMSLQWAPNENSEYTFEVFYNGYRNDSFNNLFFSFVDWWGNLGTDPASNVVLYPDTNIVKERKFVGDVYGFVSGDLTIGKTDTYIYALSGDWKIGDSFKIKADASYQDSEFTTDFFAMRAERVAPGIWVDFNSGGGIPAFGFFDNANTAVDETDLTDPSLWTIAQLYDNGGYRKGDAKTLTVDASYFPDWGFIKDLKFGLRYDDRNASEGDRTADAGVLGKSLADYPELCHVNSGFFDGESDVPTSWVVPDGYYISDHADDVRKLYNDRFASDPNYKPFATGDDVKSVENFNVGEVTTNAYIQSSFSHSFGGHLLSGQIGFRYVNVDTDMTFTADDGTISSASAKADKLLPSFTASYELTNNLRIRASYGQTLRRPNFADLNPNINYVEDVTNIGYGTASGGNPNLKPVESKNYDLSLEYYLGNASAFYVTAFKRKIDGMVATYRQRVTHEGYDYILTHPANANNGELKGWEIGAIYFPEDLPGFLKGFGVQASYTILDSEQENPVTDDQGNVIGSNKSPMFGVSDSSYSLVLAYERNKFSGRLGYVWRDDFLNNNEAAQFANPLGIYREAESSLDLQLSYNITENWVITLDATNLTNEKGQSYYQYADTNNFSSSLFSRTFSIGTRYSF